MEEQKEKEWSDVPPGSIINIIPKLYGRLFLYTLLKIAGGFVFFFLVVYIYCKV